MSQSFYKGRTNQHLTWVAVDSTDFATPKSAMSAAMTIKIYGKVRGATGVNFVSSGTGSLTNDIVHVGASATGIYTIALAKADLSDASNAWYDQYTIVLAAAGMAQQVLVVDGGIDASAISAYQSRLSDILSQALLATSAASDAASAATQANSRVLLIQSRLSDFNSAFVSQLSDFRSDLASFLTTTGVGLDASTMSDIRSAINAGPAATVTASDISDIASAVWANTIGARVDSRVLLNQSRISDVYSLLSDLNSLVATTGAPLNASTMSDLRSAINAGPAATVTASDISDIASAVRAAIVSDLSDILSAAVQTNSRVIVIQSRLSDFNSAFVSQLSDFRSDLGSFLTTTGVGLNASTMSDLRSAITGVTATLSASDISDIASAVWAAKYTAHSAASSFGSLLSDVYSRVVLIQSAASDAASAATQANSRVLLNQSRISDVYSLLSDLQSDFQSRVPKAVATNSQLSDLHSDLRSHLAVTSGVVSDIYSLLSDVGSDLTVVSGIVSDIYSNLAAGVAIGASDMSDLRSAITATELDASDLSDIASAVWATARVEPTTVPSPTGTMKTGVEWMVALSRNKITQTATVQSLRNNADAADIASAAVSDDGTVFTRGGFA